MSHINMLTKIEALKIVGVAPTSPARKDVFEKLNEYSNPFNSRAVFREDEVEELVKGFDIKSKAGVKDGTKKDT